jgi:hypothetical protein
VPLLKGNEEMRLFMRSSESLSVSSTSREKFFSPTALIGVIAIAISIAVLVPEPGIQMITNAHRIKTTQTATNAANQPNPNCILIMPADPLTAQGLATPYQLAAADPQKGACHESNKMQAAFIEGAIFDRATGTISIYDPLVIDQGAQPAVAPTPPTLPQDAIVALWFGFNGTTLLLQGADPTASTNGNCINGIAGSPFGQVSYCNAPAFFKAVYGALMSMKLTSVPPPLVTGQDGLPCPSVRDFGIVDQDQSDNVTTQYLLTATGQTAQNTTANKQALPGAQLLSNGSDNHLVVLVDSALDCQPWAATDLADPTQKLTALALNEIQAQVWQNEPVALVPNSDPMVLVNGQSSLTKLNAYREGVGQTSATNDSSSNTMAYCANLLEIAPRRMATDMALTIQRPSIDPAVADSLFTFLAQRFNTTWGNNGGLNCQGILKTASPIKVQTDNAGVVISATINVVGDTVAGNTPTQGADNANTQNNNTNNTNNNDNDTVSKK